MEKILIYYNPNHKCFYTKYSDSYFYPEVGYVNQFEHILVQVLFFDYSSNRLINEVEFKKLTFSQESDSLKNRLINQAIGFLDKLKSK